MTHEEHGYGANQDDRHVGLLGLGRGQEFPLRRSPGPLEGGVVLPDGDAGGGRRGSPDVAVDAQAVVVVAVSAVAVDRARGQRLQRNGGTV